jgi:DNA repair protein RadD
MTLRPYQVEAHDKIIEHIKSTAAPCLVELATGAGKSLIISAVADTIHKISGGKNVLCLAPSAELVTQNRSKFLATGKPASLFSASAGIKCLKHPVVFGTPGTVKNSIDKFGERFAAIIIDEAHGITPSVKSIIESIRNKNPNVRVIGLTATPYRLGSGFIYQIDDKNKIVQEDQTTAPYFDRLLYRVTAPFLIDLGYLTPPHVGMINAEGYDTTGLILNNRGQFNANDVDRVFVGHGRLTSEIISDVIYQSHNRHGVMVFASTVQHALEIMSSLPPELSELVTGNTPKKERGLIIKRFKTKKIKYLVNVSVLTTGFDVSHVDVIVLMRPTESIGLLQQIIGRGLRIDENKTDCLILDYTDNIERHCPDGDLFAPVITARNKKKSGGVIEIVCPTCEAINQFTARQNDDNFGIDEDGYFIDLAGQRIQADGGGFVPAHYGRRCQGMIYTPLAPLGLKCGHRWESKECPHCKADNDIAARYCKECKGEIVNPNDKLKLDFKALKKDPYRLQIDEVLDVEETPTVSQAGNSCLRVKFTTPYRSITVWIQTEAKNEKAWRDYNAYKNNSNPKTITYKKESNGFYRIIAYNQPQQEEPK